MWGCGSQRKTASQLASLGPRLSSPSTIWRDKSRARIPCAFRGGYRTWVPASRVSWSASLRACRGERSWPLGLGSCSRHSPGCRNHIPKYALCFHCRSRAHAPSRSAEQVETSSRLGFWIKAPVDDTCDVPSSHSHTVCTCFFLQIRVFSTSASCPHVAKRQHACFCVLPTLNQAVPPAQPGFLRHRRPKARGLNLAGQTREFPRAFEERSAMEAYSAQMQTSSPARVEMQIVGKCSTSGFEGSKAPEVAPSFAKWARLWHLSCQLDRHDGFVILRP